MRSICSYDVVRAKVASILRHFGDLVRIDDMYENT